MTTPPLAPYPALRLRRLRQADWVRRLVRETVLTPADLIWSAVVHEGEGRVAVASMPGVERWSVAEAAKAAKEAKALCIPGSTRATRTSGRRCAPGSCWPRPIPWRYRPRPGRGRARTCDSGCGCEPLRWDQCTMRGSRPGAKVGRLALEGRCELRIQESILYSPESQEDSLIFFEILQVTAIDDLRVVRFCRGSEERPGLSV